MSRSSSLKGFSQQCVLTHRDIMLSLGFCREHLNLKLRHQAEVKYEHTCLAGWEGRDALGSLLLPGGCCVALPVWCLTIGP